MSSVKRRFYVFNAGRNRWKPPKKTQNDDDDEEEEEEEVQIRGKSRG